MLDPKQCVLFSGGAAGTEQFFGAQAEAWGIEEVNYSFDGHQIERKRGVRVLTSEELALKDVSLTYVSRLMGREFTKAPLFRKVLQSICWQVSSGQEVVVVGNIQPDQTVKGGTGWGAEFAKICNKPLLVFDQEQDGWYRWQVTLPIDYLNRRIAQYGIGTLSSIEVVRRSTGGAVETLTVHGTSGSRTLTRYSPSTVS